MNLPASDTIGPDIIIVPKHFPSQRALTRRRAIVLRVRPRAELLNSAAQASDSGFLLGKGRGRDGGNTGLDGGGVEADVGDPGFVFGDGAGEVELPEGDLLTLVS